MNKEEKYRKIAMGLLKSYVDSECAVISEYSGNFKESAEQLKTEITSWLEKLDYNYPQILAEEIMKNRCRWLYDILGGE